MPRSKSNKKKNAKHASDGHSHIPSDFELHKNIRTDKTVDDVYAKIKSGANAGVTAAQPLITEFGAGTHHTVDSAALAETLSYPYADADSIVGLPEYQIDVICGVERMAFVTPPSVRDSLMQLEQFLLRVQLFDGDSRELFDDEIKQYTNRLHRVRSDTPGVEVLCYYIKNHEMVEVVYDKSTGRMRGFMFFSVQ